MKYKKETIYDYTIYTLRYRGFNVEFRIKEPCFYSKSWEQDCHNYTCLVEGIKGKMNLYSMASVTFLNQGEDFFLPNLINEAIVQYFITPKNEN